MRRSVPKKLSERSSRWGAIYKVLWYLFLHKRGAKRVAIYLRGSSNKPRPISGENCQASPVRPWTHSFAPGSGHGLDRLGRSLTELLDLLCKLPAKEVDLFSHRQGLDTLTPSDRAMFQMIGFSPNLVVQ